MENFKDKKNDDILEKLDNISKENYAYG